MVVKVGAIDPYWEQKRLQNFGNAIANAINYANEAKEKKKAKVRAEFQEALKLGQADPEAGVLAMNDLENRYKEKLLDKSVPERSAYRSLMAKKAEKGDLMKNAWDKFSASALSREQELTAIGEEVDAIPKITGLDPAAEDPQQYMNAMMQYAQGNPNAMQKPNPEYVQKMEMLQKISQPDFLAQAAMGDLSTVERVHLQQWANSEEIDMKQLFGMLDKSKLSQKVRGVAAAESGEITGLTAQAALSEAEQIVSPADEALWNYNQTMAQLRSDLRTGEIGERTRGQMEVEELRQKGTRDRLNLQSDLGIGTGSKGKKGTAGEAGEGGMTFGETLRKRKDFTAGKYKVSTDTSQQLEARAAEFIAATGGRVSMEEATNTILDIYSESFDGTSDLEDDLREAAALKKVLNWGQPEKEEEPLPPGASVAAPTIRPPQGSGGR